MNSEAIDAALLDLVWDGATFRTTKAEARILRHWNDVSPSSRPALFMAAGKRSVIRTAANGLPTHWHIERILYLYVSTQGAISPGAVLNPILDTLCARLEANAAGQAQTLGGLVQFARIEGAIETSEGTLGDTEVAILPILLSVTA
jgi:hypothetical protein